MEEPRVIIERTLAKLSPALAADGYNLRLGDMEGDLQAEIVLEMQTDACSECLVPDSVLLDIILSEIQEYGEWHGSLILRKIDFEQES
jgi:hypothetical protein